MVIRTEETTQILMLRLQAFVLIEVEKQKLNLEFTLGEVFFTCCRKQKALTLLRQTAIEDNHHSFMQVYCTLSRGPPLLVFIF